jgi:hypothetical protein
MAAVFGPWRLLQWQFRGAKMSLGSIHLQFVAQWLRGRAQRPKVHINSTP